MRDINRIYPICNALAEVWKLSPDLRFFQFLAIIEDYAIKQYNIHDLFFLEDDKIKELLDSFLVKVKKDAEH